MKKILLLSLLVVSLTTLIINQLTASNKSVCLKGNGNVTSIDRNISGFSKIDVKGAFEVIIVKSNEYNVKIEADENLLENIKTEVKDGKLYISNTKSICGYKEMKLMVYMPILNSISSSGASVIKSNDNFETEKFEIKSSGASEISAQINTKLLISKYSGASSIKLNGRADTHALETTGASSLKATELEVNKYAIDCSGASDCKIYVKDELSVTSSGASDIKYIGDPKISKSIKGASNISKL
jgi:hypothetical protein